MRLFCIITRFWCGRQELNLMTKTINPLKIKGLRKYCAKLPQNFKVEISIFLTTIKPYFASNNTVERSKSTVFPFV